VGSGARRGILRFAVATVVAAFLAVSWGGLTTSRDAGMAFSTWPLSDGSVNPDGWLGNPDKRAEHGHRIFGALLGACATVLVVWTHRARLPRAARWTSIAAWLAVAGQGLLGGSRVLENSPHEALVHGCTGQAVFCLVVATAWVLAPRRSPPNPEGPGGRWILAAASVATTLVLYLQVVLGAVLRHNHGPADQHLLGAVYVVAAVTWLAAVAATRFRGDREVARPVLLLALLLLLQVALGLSTAGILSRQVAGSHSFAEVALPTAHQTTGAVMLATSVVVTLTATGRVRHALGRPAEAFA